MVIKWLNICQRVLTLILILCRVLSLVLTLSDRLSVPTTASHTSDHCHYLYQLSKFCPVVYNSNFVLSQVNVSDASLFAKGK